MATRIKTPKADSAASCAVLEQLPNIGPALAAGNTAVVKPSELAPHASAAVVMETGRQHSGVPAA